MTASAAALVANVKAALGDKVVSVTEAFGEVTLVIKATDLLEYRPHQVHLCGLCEAARPVDAIVETRIIEYHGERRGDLYYTKAMLLAIGDRYEEQIAKGRGDDAAYR